MTSTTAPALADLGSISGLLPLLRSAGPVLAVGDAGPVVRARLRDQLNPPPWAPVTPERGRTWQADGVDGVELTWDVGFGAPTQAWLLRPAGESADLPGVVALHCHSGMKFFGKEKIADGPDGPEPDVQPLRAECYGGRAFANDLARRGYAVLVHDVFGWGSRRAPVADMPRRSESVAELQLAEAERAGRPLSESQVYDIHAGAHEDAMAKTLGVLGTSWGGVVGREDLIAVDLLNRLDGVAPGGVAVIGLSGGGARSATATALAQPGQIRATVIASMMSSYEQLLDGHLHKHTWMLNNPGLGRVADWPTVAASARPQPLFVGYGLRDALFSEAGMRAAHEQIGRLYAQAGAPDSYRGVLVDLPHSFAGEMRDEAFDWLDAVMR
jgi:alpha-beta hydrolase superfamily lysophospholipase